MNKKTIIQIIVIVAAFGGSGFVLYNGMFKKPAAPAATTATTALVPESGIKNVLPFGTVLDFKILNKQNLEYGAIVYPKLDPNQEVGIEGQALIKPSAAPKQ